MVLHVDSNTPNSSYYISNYILQRLRKFMDMNWISYNKWKYHIVFIQMAWWLTDRENVAKILAQLLDYNEFCSSTFTLTLGLFLTNVQLLQFLEKTFPDNGFQNNFPEIAQSFPPGVFRQHLHTLLRASLSGMKRRPHMWKRDPGARLYNQPGIVI